MCVIQQVDPISSAKFTINKMRFNFLHLLPFILFVNLTSGSPLPNEELAEERRRGNRRRPCVFRTKVKKGHHQGRTIFDWNFQQYDISYNHNYNIDCSGGNGGGGNYDAPSPILVPNQGYQGGGGGLLGSYFNKPQRPQQQPIFGGINNIPGIPQIGGSQSQSQSQTQAATNDESFNNGYLNPNRPILSGVGSLIGNIPHNPVAQGIGSITEGVGSILQIIPQAFQGIAQGGSGFFGFFSSGGGGAGGGSGASQSQQQSSPQTNPDDIIYNDGTPNDQINTNHDPVLPDAYNSIGRPRPRPQYNNNNGYYTNSNYNRLPYYSRYRGY